MISFQKLFKLLADRGHSRYWLGTQIGSSLAYKLREDRSVSSETIGKICAALNCQPGDIMEFIPREDRDISSKTIEKICAALNCQPGDIMEFISRKKQQNG